MNKIITLIAAFLLLTINATAQKVRIPKIEKVFLDKNDTSKNCYTIIYSMQLPCKGYMFLIPGFGETAEDVLVQTDLPQKSAMNGIMTIIPTFQDGILSFGVDNLSQQSFNEIVKDVTRKHKLQDQRFFVGGFSIGGSCAIKYAQMALIKPNAVFAIDPPLDFERIYNSAKRDLCISKLTKPNQEYIYMKGRIEQEMKGTPQTALLNFYKMSPYSFSDTAQTEIKKLIQTPIRIYSEPDIHWWLKERKLDLTCMNVTECSAMINELNRLGNNNAFLITTQNKGFRKPDNRRHPHSWSIVNNDELIKWLLK